MPDLADSAANHIPPIPFLIPDALPNDTETEELSGRAMEGRERVIENLEILKKQFDLIEKSMLNPKYVINRPLRYNICYLEKT